MKLSFTKMHGLGNDFVVFDFTQDSFELSARQASEIADRNFGVGCDQILIVEKSSRPEIDFKYRILNADGSEVGQCGNGSRCFALFVSQKRLSDKNPITVETLERDMVLDLDTKRNLVTVNMGIPKFEPNDIPLDYAVRKDTYEIDVGGNQVSFASLSIGNPHAVIQVKNVQTAPVETLGPEMEMHSIFPERANIGFMQIQNRQEFALRVFERGVGETIACGSGACAAAIAGMQNGLLDSPVTAHVKGGDLSISWAGENHPVMMTGPAVSVFEGNIEIVN